MGAFVFKPSAIGDNVPISTAENPVGSYYVYDEQLTANFHVFESTIPQHADIYAGFRYETYGSPVQYRNFFQTSNGYSQFYNYPQVFAIYAFQREVSGVGTVIDIYACNATSQAGCDTMPTQSRKALAIGVLYEDLENAGYIVESTEWEETPELDGDTTSDNVGGAFADTEPFNFTQNQGANDWPDPDLDFISPYATDAGGNPIPGLYTPYELTPTQLRQVGAVLYDSDMFDELVQKLNGSSNPISGILRCIQLPLLTNLGSGSFNIAIFGDPIYSENHGYANAAHLTGRWVQRTAGSVTVKEVWGTFRDYTDTQVSIYLPFVGVRQLDPQLVVGKSLELRCYIDAYTGDVLWLLRAYNTNVNGKFFESSGFIGRWSGNCATEIPIGRIDNTRALGTLVGAVSGAVLAPFTGGASLAMTGQSLAGMLTGGAQSMGVVSGNVTGHLGTADVLYPYLIVQRSVPAYPNGWRGKIGAIKNETYQANELSGYTLFSQIFLENMEGASGEEIEALRNELCSEGIIF